MTGRRSRSCAGLAVLFSVTALLAPGLARAGTLTLDVLFNYLVTEVDCPPGTPETTFCYPLKGGGMFPGLGKVSMAWTAVIDRSDPNPECSRWSFPRVPIVVEGKGEIDLAGKSEGCQPFAVGSVSFVVTGGTGLYAGATGSGTLALLSLNEIPVRGGRARLAAGLSVPGLAFDTTPPKLSGAKSRVVRTRKTDGVRVSFAVEAVDAVDGKVPVRCSPASGSRFRLGRTQVVCEAVDRSGNQAMARFSITVRKQPKGSGTR